MMKEYKLPSGKASIETTGGLFATTEYTVPANASERNKALHEALTECLHLSAQCGQLQLQRDIERESVKQLTAERDALAAQVAELHRHIARVNQSYKDSTGYEPSISVFHRALDEATEAAKATPQHHLRQVRADAGRDGFVADVRQEMLDKFGLFYIETQDRANQYADQIRRGEVE